MPTIFEGDSGKENKELRIQSEVKQTGVEVHKNLQALNSRQKLLLKLKGRPLKSRSDFTIIN